MADGKYVAYYRVSTARQWQSGLGLEAQQRVVGDWLDGGNWQVVASFTEVESGKDDANRPELAKALRMCRVHRATLVISKLDRLSRDAAWLLGLEKQGYDFVIASSPNVNRLTIGVLALVAEDERRANLHPHEGCAGESEGAWGQAGQPSEPVTAGGGISSRQCGQGVRRTRVQSS
jgi:DNA invertase Pin-like site-specific DNA recombinase